MTTSGGAEREEEGTASTVTVSLALVHASSHPVDDPPVRWRSPFDGTAG
jgi:hypothetical protein